ncbi:MAG: hypothetical protein MUP67_04885, partial [Acidimicrobiia bacterium]|nr:hypothetical protein [Acidimicrobiia bacterium]
FSVKPGSAYRICEVLQAGWVNSDPSDASKCKTTEVAVSGTPQSLVLGNYNTATFTVRKDFSDNSQAGVTVSLACTGSPGGTVINVDTTASEANPASFTVNGFGTTTGTTCTATETAVPAGYTSSGTCTASLADGECTIVNTLNVVPPAPPAPPAPPVNTATFTVRKDFSDDNPASVPIRLSCTSGTVAANDATASEADTADFTVFGFTGSPSCTATEDPVPDGYTSSGPCNASLTAGTGSCTITNTADTAEVVRVPRVRPVSSVRRRALVAGEFLRLSGTAPDGCDPILDIDGESRGRVDTARDGTFDISYRTTDLAAGRHVATVVCSSRNATLLSKVFWVAAPISNSSIVLVALASLLVLFAIGWVGFRTLAGN